MKLWHVVITFTALANSAMAQEDEVSKGCLKNGLGQVVCTQALGSVAINGLGQVVCAPGECVKNGLGQFQCSREHGGYAMKDGMGIVKCTGGCVYASSSYCQYPSY